MNDAIKAERDRVISKVLGLVLMCGALIGLVAYLLK
jgi:hypothetical protein